MMLSEQAWQTRAAAIRGLILDVDGVLTDGRIILDATGGEVKEFSVRDGFGIRSWQRVGGKVAILSGRSSPAVERRAADLDIDPVVLGKREKGPALAGILAAWQLPATAVAFVGDDLPDLPVMLACGLGVCPADAVPEVRDRADRVLTAVGGQGAVRELIELLLTAQGRWQEVIDHYSRPA